MTSLSDRIFILGCGCFGVSTAYHLLKRGYTNITILERASVVPAPDAASNDINRIVRSSYADRFYTELAREAISLWRDRDAFGDAYQESGFIILGFPHSEADASSSIVPQEVEAYYAVQSYHNDVALGADVSLLESPGAIRAAFRSDLPSTSFEGKSGYLNRDGGWADAGKGMQTMIGRIRAMGAVILTGKHVTALIRAEDGRTTGVRCQDGSQYDADLVVVATGSWTPSALPGLDFGGSCLATGQCVAMIQLTPEEAAPYKACPIILDLETGFYVFPPTELNVLKFAIHSLGYTNPDPLNGNVSTPRTSSSDPSNGMAIPKPDLQRLREHLRDIYPELSEKPFCATRLCWYNDSPDGDWVISRYPRDLGLVLATAGSGHAYKFLPNIGRIVSDLIQDKLAPELITKFSVSRTHTKSDTSRQGLTQQLPLDLLCTPEDLIA